MTTATQAQIYVACLASYNAGILHGAWIDAHQSPDALYDEVQTKVLQTSSIPNAEEWAIHDIEGLYGLVGEYTGLPEVSAIAAFIATHGELGAALLKEYPITEADEMLEEHYAGAYDDASDFAEELTRECQTIPKFLEYYIDWTAMARDMQYSGDIHAIGTTDGKTHIFWNR